MSPHEKNKHFETNLNEVLLDLEQNEIILIEDSHYKMHICYGQNAILNIFVTPFNLLQLAHAHTKTHYRTYKLQKLYKKTK